MKVVVNQLRICKTNLPPMYSSERYTDEWIDAFCSLLFMYPLHWMRQVGKNIAPAQDQIYFVSLVDHLGLIYIMRHKDWIYILYTI